MDTIYNNRIQIIVIAVSAALLVYIVRKILKGKLREEYSIIWILLAAIIIFFSVWREGIEIISRMLGVISAPNLIFTIAIFFIYIYLIHLSIANTKLQNSLKSLLQKNAILEEKLKLYDKGNKEK